MFLQLIPVFISLQQTNLLDTNVYALLFAGVVSFLNGNTPTGITLCLVTLRLLKLIDYRSWELMHKRVKNILRTF